MSRRRRTAPAPPTIDDLPPEFRDRMAGLLGSEVEEMLQALITPASGLRVNSVRADPQEYGRTAPFPLEPLSWPPEGFLVTDPEARPGLHPHHAAGVYYLQDPGAMVVGALPTLPHSPRVLDLAAAPGGKATHIGARMAGEGVLVANDVSASRARELTSNLERCGVRAVVTSATATTLADHWGSWFDLVLLDAPCSGESMFHKSSAARSDWSPDAVGGCARRQEDLLHEALRLTRPGGLILYSTCTFSPEENEQVLSHFLRTTDRVHIEALPSVPGAVPGRPEWAGAGVTDGIENALRLWPHRVPGAGHFIAALRVAPSDPDDEAEVGAAGQRRVPGSIESVDREARASLEEFLAAAAPGLDLGEGELMRRGDDLFLLPHGSPPLDGIRVLWPGWWLGTLKPGRFEPSHALAMGMPGGAAAQALSLPSDSAEIVAYLWGETLRLPGEDGWLRMEVDGHPLGWGKRTQGVIKNHYPRGLRRA